MQNELKNLSREQLAKFILGLPDCERNYLHVSAMTGRSVDTLRRHYKHCFVATRTQTEESTPNNDKKQKTVSRTDVVKLIKSIPNSQRNYLYVSQMTGLSINTLKRHYKELFTNDGKQSFDTLKAGKTSLDAANSQPKKHEPMGSYFNHFFGELVEQVKNLQSTVSELTKTVDSLTEKCSSQEQKIAELNQTRDAQAEKIKIFEEKLPDMVSAAIAKLKIDDNFKFQSPIETLIYQILHKNFFLDTYRDKKNLGYLVIQPSWKIGETRRDYTNVGYKTHLVTKDVGPESKVWMG